MTPTTRRAPCGTACTTAAPRSSRNARAQPTSPRSSTSPATAACRSPCAAAGTRPSATAPATTASSSTSPRCTRRGRPGGAHRDAPAAARRGASSTRATQEHGLAITGGRFSTTGIAGLTLGSGSGWLERKCGLTADNLVSVDMVTADGQIVTAQRGREPRPVLGHARRRRELRRRHVVHVPPAPGRADDLRRHARRAARPRPRGAARVPRPHGRRRPTTSAPALAFVSAPPEPFVPAEMHGTPVLGIDRLLGGRPRGGRAAVAPLREATQPVIDMVAPDAVRGAAADARRRRAEGHPRVHEGRVHGRDGRRGDRQARRARHEPRRARWPSC